MTSTVTRADSEQPVKATPADGPSVAQTLAAAFFDDPVVSWCYPDPARRKDVVPEMFAAIVRTYQPHGGVWTTPANVAAAVWGPPGAVVDEEQLASELGRISGPDADRLFTVLELLDAHHPAQPAHQYLFLLGTRPEWQCQGLGSRLMRPVLSECDRDGTPAYLEATSEGSKRLYERHGFGTTKVLQLPDGPHIWCMWRSA